VLTFLSYPRSFVTVHKSVEDFVMPRPEEVAAVADRFRLLGDPTRLMVVVALAQGESNPGCLAELAGVAPAALSQHLSKLRLAGVVRPRRDGQRVWYELVDSGVRDLVRSVLTAATSPTTVPVGTEGHA
jgi:DNA-binding transcriptional ArsR family regulator